MKLLDRTVVVGPFQCNCRILACPKTGEALLVDPGDEPQKILKAIDQAEKDLGQPIRVKYLLHTHAHLDHIGGTRAVKEALAGRVAGAGAEIVLHQADDFIYQQLKMQGGMFGIQYDDPLPVDRFCEHEQELRVGEMKLTVVHTPGHSPGGVCYRLHEDSATGAEETLFSGDTLFHRSVGRTDLWGANADQMFQSIRERILTLDGDTRVCPGHGPETTVGEEKHENPFLS
mgnify:CR=1 FL=1